MTPRERVLTALNHKEPDRVPIDLGGTWVTTIHTDAYQELAKYIGLPAAVKIRSFITNTVSVDRKILEFFKIDIRSVSPELPENWREGVHEDKSYTYYLDEWGIRWRKPKKNGYYYDIENHPLSQASVKDLQHYEWPDPTHLARVQGMRKRAEHLYKNTDYAIVGDVGEAGIFEQCWFLRGMDNFCMDLISNPKFAESLMDIVLQIQKGIYEIYLREIGNYIHVVTIGDDIAGQRGPLISPELYKKIVKPRHRELLQFIRKHTQAKIFFHSCGAVKRFLPDFIEMGVDIINPVQVSAKGMDIREIKKEFGQDLVFWGGGCDTQKILPFGKKSDVEKEVKKRIDELAAGGGFVFAPVHNIQRGTPPENIIAMYHTAVNFGKYSHRE